MVIEKEEVIHESEKVANFFHSCFESVTESFDLFNSALEPYSEAKDLVESIIQRVSHHPSITEIKQNFKTLKNILFTLVTADTVKSIINRLPKWKLVSSKLVESLKLSDIVAVYKEGHHI